MLSGVSNSRGVGKLAIGTQRDSFLAVPTDVGLKHNGDTAEFMIGSKLVEAELDIPELSDWRYYLIYRGPNKLIARPYISSYFQLGGKGFSGESILVFNRYRRGFNAAPLDVTVSLRMWKTDVPNPNDLDPVNYDDVNLVVPAGGTASLDPTSTTDYRRFNGIDIDLVSPSAAAARGFVFWGFYLNPIFTDAALKVPFT